MLSINNKYDVEKMMNYHRTRDISNLIKYFPELSPIVNLIIVESIDDYNNNYDYCKKLTAQRNDNSIWHPVMRSIEIKGKQDVFNTFDAVKKIDSDGVLILFDLCHEPSERYERYAGISVGVSLGQGIYIDAVGKGFDGREVSKGLSTHERYFIPWFDIRKLNISNFKNYRTYLVEEKDYLKSREDRILFLTSIGISKDIARKEVPETYKDIPDFIWGDIIKNIIKKLESMEEELRSVGLDEFAISGHTEGKRYRPWQIFDKSRYINK